MTLIRIVKKVVPKQLKFLIREVLGITAFNHITIANDGLEETITKLERKYRFFKPTIVKFLVNFYRYLLQLETNLPLYSDSNLLIVHCTCWGEKYAEKMKHHFLSSLLSPNNLPKVSQKFKTVLLIHCDEKTRETITSSPLFEELNKYAVLNFVVVSDQFLSTDISKLTKLERFILKKSNFLDTFKYILLGGLQTHAFKTAYKNKSFISFMMPDVILSDSFFSAMFDEIKDRKVAVNTTYRTHFKKMREQIEKYYKDASKTVLTIPAETLIDLQIKNIHEATKRRIVSELTSDFTPCAQLLFEDKNGYIIRSFHYHPILINCARLDTVIKMDYFPIDNSVLNQMLVEDRPYEQQVVICNNAKKIAWVELSDDNIDENFVSRQSSNYAGLLKLIQKMTSDQPTLFATPLNRYFFSIRNEVLTNQVVHKQITVDDKVFAYELESYLSALATQQELH